MKKRLRVDNPAGMCPMMTKPPAKKPRKKPNPYKAPITVRKYYNGLNDGIRILRDDLLNLIEDDEIKEIISNRAKVMAAAQSKRLTELEKQKTKQRIKNWEEKEWESI